MYNIGDKVVIKQREGDGQYYPYVYVDEMTVYAKHIAVIEEIVSDYIYPEDKERSYYNGDDSMYRLNIDNHDFYWHSSMFEPYIENKEFLNLRLFV